MKTRNATQDPADEIAALALARGGRVMGVNAPKGAKDGPPDFLALDPSSSAIGYARFAGGQLRECGHVRSSAGTFQHRMIALVGRLYPHLAPQLPIVMELHHGREMAWQRKQKGGRRLAATVTLCHGQGWLLGWLESEGHEVETITDREWTKNKNKDVRAALIHRRYPEFSAVWAKDKGGDAADAVGLGEYYLERLRESELERRAVAAGGKALMTKVKRNAS